MNKYQEALNKLCSRCYVESDECTCHARYEGGKCNETCKYREALQELVDEYNKTKIKPIKTKKHSWKKEFDGTIDVFGYTNGEYCNGPVCEICGYGFCHHCGNHYDDETCDEHYVCKCGQHLKGTEKHCPHCDRQLDWSD